MGRVDRGGQADEDVTRSIDDPGRIDREAAAAWLKARWRGDPECPVCRGNNWAIGERAVEVVEQPAWELVEPKRWPGVPAGLRQRTALPQRRYPLLVLTCSGCGHTLFFNTVLAGLTTT
jgi:hypothetical protein